MKTLPFSPGRIDDLFIFRSEQDFLCVFRAGEGTWDSLCAAVAAEVVLVEDDVRSIGILKALFRLEGLAQRIAAVDPGFEILQVAVDVGLQAVLAVLFDQLDLNLRPLVGQFVLLMLTDRRAAEIGAPPGRPCPACPRAGRASATRRRSGRYRRGLFRRPDSRRPWASFPCRSPDAPG